MPDQRVVLIDTGILHHIVGLDGDGPDRRAVLAQFDEREANGDLFVIPVTAIIETGNHIAQSAGDRRSMAELLVKVIREAQSPDPPWIIRATTWDATFLNDLVAGDSTGSDLITLLGDGRMGSGDVAILVERDRFRRETAYTAVEVWTADDHLRAHGSG